MGAVGTACAVWGLRRRFYFVIFPLKNTIFRTPQNHSSILIFITRRRPVGWAKRFCRGSGQPGLGSLSDRPASRTLRSVGSAALRSHLRRGACKPRALRSHRPGLSRAAVVPGGCENERLRFWGTVNVAGHRFLKAHSSSSHCQQIRTIVRLNIEGTLEMTHPHPARFSRPHGVPFRIINVASTWRPFTPCRSRPPTPRQSVFCWISRWRCATSWRVRDGRDGDRTVPGRAADDQRGCLRAIDDAGAFGPADHPEYWICGSRDAGLVSLRRPRCISGMLNRLLQVLGSLLPASLVAALIGSSWSAAASAAGAASTIVNSRKNVSCCRLLFPLQPVTASPIRGSHQAGGGDRDVFQAALLHRLHGRLENSSDGDRLVVFIPQAQHK